jgi:serine/threonine-protein kinase
VDTTLADPLVGRLLDGRYLIEARVARGGMASVYRATDERLDRSVAVKVMQPALAESDEFVRRFIREAQSAARLSHPHVVNVFDQGRDGEIVFLVMEYVEGRNLRDVLRAAGRLTPGQAVGVLEPIAAAVAAAHRAGIVHRDMKPENVLIATDGRIKVADFGLARAIESSSITMTQGQLIGSPAYLAPEQLERGVADPRADVYAIGVMAFELLTGRPPYVGEMAMAVALQHLQQDVPPPSRFAAVPAALDELVVAATRRDPDLRPADGSELLARLQHVERSIAAEPLPMARPLAPDVHETVVMAPGRPAATTVGPVRPGGPEWPGKPVDDEEPEARRPRRRRTGWIWFAVVLLLAAAAAGSGAYLATHRAPSKPGVSAPVQVGVPDLSNKTIGEALAQVGNDFVIATGAEKPSLTVAKGNIVDQLPKSGGQADKGSTITVSLSSGPATHKLPDLAGKTLTDAETALTRIHVTLDQNVQTEYSPTVAAGLVIRSLPKAGATVHEGDSVAVWTSNGPQMITVPDERQQPQADGVAALKKAGFTVTVGQAFSDTVAPGVIMAQQPTGGQLPKNAPVAVTVSKGPELVTVPRLAGMTATDADAALRALGLVPKGIQIIGGSQHRVVDQAPLNQSPAPNEKVRKGTSVTYWYF